MMKLIETLDKEQRKALFCEAVAFSAHLEGDEEQAKRFQNKAKELKKARKINQDSRKSIHQTSE